MSDRNRASGWKYAKLSGHNNEKLIDEIVNTDVEYQKRILKCANVDFCTDSIISINYGGFNETDVEDIFMGKTKSKTDMSISLASGKKINISIKKSTGGQVYLIPIQRFIEGFQIQYKKLIPSNVKRAIKLFWGSAEDTEEIINTINSNYIKYELHKHRLTAYTLQQYNQELYFDLINWFKENIVEIFDFCFSKGLAKNREDWADIIWYKNEVDNLNLDTMFNINDLEAKLIGNRDVNYGTVNGGTTIQLPFGFVQWHSPQKTIPGFIQFHHNFKKINNI